MQQRTNKYQIDMCRGPLFGQIVLFSVPLMLSGLLQLLFNAADLIVVGRFASHEALAAVGATSSLTALIVNVFMGLSVGTNVLVANFFADEVQAVAFFLIAAMTQDDAEHTQGYEGAEHDHGGLY